MRDPVGSRVILQFDIVCIHGYSCSLQLLSWGWSEEMYSLRTYGSHPLEAHLARVTDVFVADGPAAFLRPQVVDMLDMVRRVPNVDETVLCSLLTDVLEKCGFLPSSLSLWTG